MTNALPQPSPADELVALGRARLAAKDFRGAQESLELALKQNPTDDRALSLMGTLAYFAGQNPAAALGFYMRALEANPGDREHKDNFAFLAGNIKFNTRFNPLVKATFVRCLETPDIAWGAAHVLWHMTLADDPAFESVYRLKHEGGMKRAQPRLVFDRARFAACRDFKPLLDPFFLRALGKMAVPLSAFEEFLTRLRRALLDDLAARKKRFGDGFAPLAAALAQYCFHTEYIFDLGKDEERQAEALRARIEAGGAGEMEIAVHACYAPPYTLSNALKIEADFASSPALKEMVATQLTHPFRLMKKRAEIPALTPIGEGVSSEVRAQYEEFPYPRWHAPGELPPQELFNKLRNKKARILVAGCGTGKEAAVVARFLPDAEILAVDLSRTSLSWAIREAEELGLGNVSFAQADILKLDPAQLGTFDAITSSGVLHHMNDPLQGWRVLTGLLKPDGLMRIALYSETAREYVVRARDAIAKGGFPGTPHGMRAFRAVMDETLGRAAADDLRLLPDAYQMSMLKDLLFHVQEHRFTLPQIRGHLEELGLEFIRFMPTGETMSGYLSAYPADRDAANIDNWEAFEKKNPRAFIHMYQFWCRKK